MTGVIQQEDSSGRRSYQTEINYPESDFYTLELGTGAKVVAPKTCEGLGCQITTNLKKCKDCRDVYYCSEECQRTDWEQHKAICRTVKQAREKEKEEHEKQKNDGGNTLKCLAPIITLY